MKSLIALLILTACLWSGANWVYVATSKTYSRVYIDSQNIKRITKDDVTYWDKAESSDGSSNMSHSEMDRAQRRYRILSGIKYDRSGNVEWTSDVPGGWTDIVPGSVADLELDWLFPN
jgi:hypothetical protein